MYIVISKDTKEYIRDTGTNSNNDIEGIYNNLLSTIDKDNQDIIQVDDNSIFIKIFNILLDEDKKFKVELDDKNVVGIMIL